VRRFDVQVPVLIFDHINKKVAAIQPGPTRSEKLDEVLATQRKQVATASGRPAR
jgi:hypothetical protein